ncbi:MAG TPA: hypothetical protein VFK61_03700, partial [Candidatus Limnocylindria bacterium]|nr:hypothetical protein [Candidatus Limnocylindria bacterium]
GSPTDEERHLTIRLSAAEQLDHAVERLLAGERPVVDSSMRPLLEAATLVRAALPPIPGGPGFEARLLSRLAGRQRPVDVARRGVRRVAGWRPGRMVAAGAVSSAAVGVTVTAYAVWRSRRHAAARAGS